MTMQLGRRLSGVLGTVLLALGLLAGARFASALHGRLDRAERTDPLPAVLLGRFAEGDLVARVRFPRLRAGFDVLEGVDASTLARAAGHVPGTALPGGPGGGRHALIAVPRDVGGDRLAALRLSDAIEMKTPFGARRYVVVARSVIEASKISVEAGSASRDRVTLISPFPVDAIGPAPLRLAILAEADSARPVTGAAVDSPSAGSIWRSSRRWLDARSAAPLRSSQLLEELRHAIHRVNL